MFKLKKANVLITDDKESPKRYRVNPKLIPNLQRNDYKLLLYFDLKDDGQGQDKPIGSGKDRKTDEPETVTGTEDNQAVL